MVVGAKSSTKQWGNHEQTLEFLDELIRIAKLVFWLVVWNIFIFPYIYVYIYICIYILGRIIPTD